MLTIHLCSLLALLGVLANRGQVEAKSDRSHGHHNGPKTPSPSSEGFHPANTTGGTTASMTTSATPQMGWNSWNTFKANISEGLISTTADLLVSLGLRDAGYTYLIVDEGWQASTRDDSGRQQADSTRFPSGIPNLAEKLHSQDLKLGIYSDAGVYDCAFYPGSWGNEKLDAETYAQWGVDYLKYDNCGQFEAAVHSPYDRFSVMRNALEQSGRPILYSMCSWGNQFPWFWADQIAYSYRMSGDIKLSFSQDSSGVCKTAYCMNQGYAGCSVTTIMRKMRELSPFQKLGAWLDMDMLVIGCSQHNISLTPAQERTHFSFWSALKSPLIIGADLRSISNSSVEILTNKEIIRLNQDPLGVAPRYLPELSQEGGYQLWTGPLQDNQTVVLIFNEGVQNGLNITVSLTEVAAATQGWEGFQEYSLVANSSQIVEVWTGEDIEPSDALVVSGLGWNDTAVYVLSS